MGIENDILQVLSSWFLSGSHYYTLMYHVYIIHLNVYIDDLTVMYNVTIPIEMLPKTNHFHHKKKYKKGITEQRTWNKAIKQIPLYTFVYNIPAFACKSNEYFVRDLPCVWVFIVIIIQIKLTQQPFIFIYLSGLCCFFICLISDSEDFRYIQMTELCLLTDFLLLFIHHLIRIKLKKKPYERNGWRKFPFNLSNSREHYPRYLPVCNEVREWRTVRENVVRLKSW